MLYLVCSPADLIATLVLRRFFFTTKSCVCPLFPSSASCPGVPTQERVERRAGDAALQGGCRVTTQPQRSPTPTRRSADGGVFAGLADLILPCGEHHYNSILVVHWSRGTLGNKCISHRSPPLILFARVGGTRDGLDCTSLRDACK